MAACEATAGDDGLGDKGEGLLVEGTRECAATWSAVPLPALPPPRTALANPMMAIAAATVLPKTIRTFWCAARGCREDLQCRRTSPGLVPLMPGFPAECRPITASLR